MPRVFANTTIAAGQSLSTSIDCRSGTPMLLFMPAQWTSALISFQLSSDGATFWNLYDASAKEISTNIRAGTAVILDPGWAVDALGCYLKIRSGSNDGPVPQAADRVFTLLINT